MELPNSPGWAPPEGSFLELSNKFKSSGTWPILSASLCTTWNQESNEGWYLGRHDFG